MLKVVLLAALSAALLRGALFTSVDSPNCSSSGTNYASCSSYGTKHINGIDYPVKVDLSASAEYEHILLDAFVESPEPNWSETKASFSESARITGPTASAGYLQYVLTGHVRNFTWGGTNISFAAGGCIFSTSYGTANYESDVTYTTNVCQFFFGVPFPVSLYGRVGEWVDSSEAGRSILDLRISEIRVFDALHNPLTAYTLTTSPGPLTTLPEPGSFLLTGLALAGLLLLRPFTRR